MSIRPKETDSMNGTLLWDIAIRTANEKNELKTAEDKNNEKNLLFVGCRESGKTSIVFSFTERVDESAKPTIALDYTFCRKQKTNSAIIKDVGNVWELGDGIFLLKLIDIVIKPETVFNTSVVITLDLSKLNELWVCMEKIIDYLQKRIHECVKKACKDQPQLKDLVKSQIQKRIGDNPDRSKLEPFEIPVVILATKYDVFETFEPEKRKIVCKTLRFVAHYYGAMLMFSSYKYEMTTTKIKALLNNFLFDGTFNYKQVQFDHMKPIIMPFGMDTFESIGQPPLSAADLNDPNHKTPIDLWRTVFCKHYPQDVIKKDENLLKDHGNDPQFAEPIIDSLKEQKLRELDNLRELLRKRQQQQSASKSVNIQIIS